MTRDEVLEVLMEAGLSREMALEVIQRIAPALNLAPQYGEMSASIVVKSGLKM